MPSQKCETLGDELIFSLAKYLGTWQTPTNTNWLEMLLLPAKVPIPSQSTFTPLSSAQMITSGFHLCVDMKKGWGIFQSFFYANDYSRLHGFSSSGCLKK